MCENTQTSPGTLAMFYNFHSFSSNQCVPQIGFPADISIDVLTDGSIDISTDVSTDKEEEEGMKEGRSGLLLKSNDPTPARGEL